jgi:hypothetical protein
MFTPLRMSDALASPSAHPAFKKRMLVALCRLVFKLSGFCL